MARQAASAMAAMSDDQLAAMLAQSGMPGVTPDIAKQAAAMMRSMPPDQLAAMAQAQAAAGFPGAPAAGAPAQAAAPAVAAAGAVSASAAATSSAAAAAAAGGSPDQMAAAAEAMKQNPEMLKQVGMGAYAAAGCPLACAVVVPAPFTGVVARLYNTHAGLHPASAAPLMLSCQSTPVEH